LSADQKALLSIQFCENEADVLELMCKCIPWYRANSEVIQRLTIAESSADLRKLSAFVKSQVRVTDRVRKMVLNNAEMLGKILD
jgi:hypothetical protein